MTTEPSDLVVRALGAAEAQSVFRRLPDSPPTRLGLPERPYAPVSQGGEYRPEWTWVAMRGSSVVARAAFRGAADDAEPRLLDRFDFAPGERDAAVQLLQRTPLRAELELVLPPGWRDDPAVRAAAEARIDAAAAAGYRPLVERYRYAWTPDRGLPAPPERLTLHPEPDDERVLDVLRRVSRGSLDAHARQAVAEGGGGAAGVERAAREDFAFLRRMPSPRHWWRVARTPEGRLAGLHVPGRTSTGEAAVAFIGVVPEQRGNGYAYELLADCTRQLAAEGATSVAAATDVGNAPMAAAFARAGYPVVQHRWCMSPPAD